MQKNQKIKANPNASGRFASQRHVTSMFFEKQFINRSTIQQFLKRNQYIYYSVAGNVYLRSKYKNTVVAVLSKKIKCG